MNLTQCLQAVDYKLCGRSFYDFLGIDARIWKFRNKKGEEIGSFISSNLEEVLLVEVLYTDKNKTEKKYRWTNKDLEDEKDMLKTDYSEIRNQFLIQKASHICVYLENEKDMLEKLKAICNEEDFDERFDVPINLKDDEFLALAKIAHSKDITFNKQVAFVLEDVIKNTEKYKAEKIKMDNEEIINDVSNKVSNKVGKIKRLEQEHFTLTVQENEIGELFLQFTNEMLDKMGWEIGDVITWVDNKDGSFLIKKNN